MPLSETKALRMARPSLVRTGMFCKFGSTEESRPVVVGGERVGGVHAARLGVDIGRQRVGIGALELGEQAPVEHLARQLVAFRGKLLERARIGAPGAGLGAPPARPGSSCRTGSRRAASASRC